MIDRARDSLKAVEAEIAKKNRLFRNFVKNLLCLLSCVHISFDKTLCLQ